MWNQYTVRDIMTPIEKGVVVRSHEKMLDVLRKMEESDTRRVLVADDGKLEGIITTSDLIRWLIRARSLQDWQNLRR
ncbi:zn-dependent protease [Leptolyngbya sp. Heron Island J]|nr:zn-dependent protease [Leptolyngbya sp. Heron Island J]